MLCGLFVQWDWQALDGQDGGLSQTQLRDAFAASDLVPVRIEQAFIMDLDGLEMPVVIGVGCA